MESVLILLLVLGLVTVVGHGIWVAAAWLLRGGRRRRDRIDFEPTYSDDRAATARYLRHLQSRAVLDDETHARLMKLIAIDVPPMPTPPEHAARTHELTEAQAEETSVDDWAGELQEAQPRPWPEPAPCPPEPASARQGVAFEAKQDLRPPPLPKPEVPASPPRRPLGVILASFMAEKNIRWGELVGGLLIVGSSTALVISLWSQIESIPVFKFLIFTAVTAGLFGAGLFVHHRWNLPTTGHALLITSTLLVPLNLLAFAAFSQPRTVGDGWTIGSELVAIVLFGWLAFLAGRVVMTNAPVLFAAGVAGLSSCSLVIRYASPLTNTGLLGTSLIPLGPYVAVMAVSVWRQSRARQVDDEEAKRLLLGLGVQSLACLVPLGLLLYQTGRAAEALRVLAPLVCVLAGPALATGLLLWRRLSPTAYPQIGTAAASVALVAVGVMILGAGLSWPVPSRLLPALLVNLMVMVVMSRLTRHPAVHAAGALWFAAAWTIGFHLISGGLSWSTSTAEVAFTALLSSGSGKALVAAVAAFLIIAVWLGRRQRHLVSRAYVLVALALALISVALVTAYGFGVAGDDKRITWVYLVYAAAAFASARRRHGALSAWCGGVLVQMAILQVLVYVWPTRHFVWPTALLVGSTAFGTAALILKWRLIPPSVVQPLAGPMTWLAALTSLSAAAWLAVIFATGTFASLAVRTAWLSALWLALAFMNCWPLMLAGSQAALVVAVCAAVQHHIGGLAWYGALSSPLYDPRVWQAHLLVTCVLCMVWALARTLLVRRYASGELHGEAPQPPTGRQEDRLELAVRLLNPRIPAFDRWVTALVLLGLVGLSGWSIGPVLLAEHGWQMQDLPVTSHAHAAGAGAWLLLALLFVTLALHMSEGIRGLGGLGMVVVMACGTALLAARIEAHGQVVSTWRWLLASAFLITSIVVWTRRFWLERVSRLTVATDKEGPLPAGSFRLALAGLFAVPALLLTITYSMALVAGDVSPPDAQADAWLRLSLLGPMALVVICVIGYGIDERKPTYPAAAAILASALVLYTETIVHSLSGLPITYEFVVWLVQLNALVIAATAIIWRAARGWTVSHEDPSGFPRWPLLASRVTIGIMLLLVAVGLWIAPESVSAALVRAGTLWGIVGVLLVEWALFAACHTPDRDLEVHRPTLWLFFGALLVACSLGRFDTGNWLCFHALMVSLVAAGWLRIYAGSQQVRRLIGAGWQETYDTASAQARGLAGEIDHDLSCIGCGYNVRGLLPSARCPECNEAIASSLEAAVNRLTPQWASHLLRARAQTVVAVMTFTALGTVFALRSAVDDPQLPWWSTAVLAALSALCIALAARTPSRVLAYVGGLEVCLAASVCWIPLRWGKTGADIAEDFCNLLSVNIVAIVITGLCWLFVERKVLSRRLTAGNAGRWPAFHDAAAVISAIAVAAMAGLTLFGTATHEPLRGVALLSWTAWATATLLMILCGLRRSCRYAPAGLYALGLTAVVLITAHSGVSSLALPGTLSLALAGYVLLMTLAYRTCARIVPSLSAMSAEGPLLSWANAALTTVSVLLGSYVILNDPRLTMRMLIVCSPVLCAGAAVLAAAGIRRTAMETRSLILIAVGGVLLAWSWVQPDTSAEWLYRAIGLIAAITVLTASSSAALFWIHARPSWMTAVRRTVVGMNAVAIAALLCCSCYEALTLVEGRTVSLGTAATAAMIVALATMIVCCMVFAIHDRLDPLQVKANVKGAYVYAAEILGGLLTLHLGATMPWLFSGVVARFWPMLVIALALAAAAVGEVLERRGLRELALPFGRTGVFLPMLVLIELLIAASQVHYSIVLLTAGAFYAALAGLRRSVWIGALSALSLNGSLWYLLHHSPGFGITQHPQLWFIPPSLAVLAAGHLNRDRLREPHRRALHYGCLLIIYLSSTADIFLVGVAQAPWLPLVLAGLSVAGILIGFASRVRSFLFLGTGFLCLSLLTMIWHAAANLGWTWAWYVAGIALGAGIITLFALFEKKRSKMTAWFAEMKDWAE
ncbi:MAG: hypothetical protein JSU68_01725 [Phycisphaerales bacterium]|nr:MAG: hypothetical protein JSU68_01725 [Phycisphaerales bacterium]